MKSVLIPLLLAFSVSDLWDQWPLVRREIDPQKADEALQRQREVAARKPGDLWAQYNLAVAAYAAKNYDEADRIWQELSSATLPEPLQAQVWLQLGNVSYRLATSQIEKEPDLAVSRLEQSREAFRVVLSQRTEDGIAQHNLLFVETELEKLYARLASQLVAEAKEQKKPEAAIEKLHPALDYQQQATALSPANLANVKAEQDIRRMIADAHSQIAARDEKSADARLAKGRQSGSEREKAKEEYERAIASFQQAQNSDQGHEEGKQGEERVQQKLADLLADNGRREQKSGDQQAKSDPQDALESYQDALASFDQALGVQPEHQDATEGKQEVRDSMEKLHIDQGDKQMARGEQQLKKAPADATENLLSALDHFEQALGINPENEETEEKIAKVKEMLPDLLAAQAQQQQEEARQEEKKQAIPQAISQLEKAESNYEQALQMQPEHQQAQQGQAQTEEDLERLRNELAQQQPQPAEGKSEKVQQAEETFQTMLAKVKAQQEPKEVNARHRLGTGYDPSRDSTYRNW